MPMLGSGEDVERGAIGRVGAEGEDRRGPVPSMALIWAEYCCGQGRIEVARGLEHRLEVARP